MEDKDQTFSKLGKLIFNFLSTQIRTRELRLDKKPQLINTNFRVKFQFISYNFFEILSNELIVLLIFWIYEPKITKIERPKSKKFFVLKIKTLWHQNKHATIFRKWVNVGIGIRTERYKNRKKSCLKTFCLNI